MKNEVKRVIAVLLPICFFAILLSCGTISVVNDMYAFIKPEREVTLLITGAQSVDEISGILGENNIISNPFCFSAYVKNKNKVAEILSFQGEITLNSKMSYREILAVFL